MVLRSNMHGFAGQNAAYCEPKCMVLQSEVDAMAFDKHQRYG